MEEKSKLEKLKENYLKAQEKFGLPSFDEMNRDFYIEKLSDEETDYLVREIRRYVSEKFSNYLRYFEALLNPSNVPMFTYSMVRALGAEEKKKVEEIYKKLARTQVELFEMEVSFSEERDAEFVKNSFVLWSGVKKDLLEILKVIKENWDNKTEGNSKGYFG